MAPTGFRTILIVQTYKHWVCFVPCVPSNYAPVASSSLPSWWYFGTSTCTYNTIGILFCGGETGTYSKGYVFPHKIGARYKEMDGDSVPLDAVSRSLPPLKSAWIRFTPPLIFYNRVPKCASQTILSLTKNLSRINNFTYQHSRVFQEYTIDESKQVWSTCSWNQHVVV